MVQRRKLWVSVGTAVLAFSPATVSSDTRIPPVQTASLATPSPIVVAQAKHHGGERGKADNAVNRGAGTKAKAGGEGEGGEGGEAGAGDSTLEPSLRFYRNIQLIRGHLLVGDELVQEGRWAEALPHFLHPGEEIYGKVRGDLKTYNVPPFATALKALAQTVKAKNKQAYSGALATVEERLAAIDKELRAREVNWPYFALETVLETLRSAWGEYEEAVEGEKIGNAVEYQDSRGFVWQAERLFSSVADDLTRKDSDAVGAIRAAFADLRTAWPSATPPKKPVKDLSQVLSDVARIELQLNRFK